MITFLLLFIGVIFGTDLPQIHKHDPELNKYFDSYITLIHQKCEPGQYNYTNRTTIEFVDVLEDQSWVGVCEQSDNIINALSFWNIKIVRPKWITLSEIDKTSLMYHEFTHCLFDQKHVEDPMNYMYPMMIDIELSTLEKQVLESAWTHCGNK